MKGKMRVFLEVGLWGAFWSAAFAFSVGTFGHLPALTTLAALAVFTSYVWYRTGRREREEREAVPVREKNRNQNRNRG